MRAAQISLGEIGLQRPDLIEIDAVQIGARQIGAVEPRAAQRGAGQIEAGQVETIEALVGEVEFFVALVGSGELTPRLFALAVGDRLFLGPKPKGLFTLTLVPTDKNVLMVATGTGLAPYVSMLRTHLAERPGQRIAVLHGASFSWDLGYRAELERMAAHHDNLVYLPVVSRPNQAWTGWSGRLPGWLDSPELPPACRFDLDPATAHVLLCGNPGMIEEARARLEAKGYQTATPKVPGSLHVEKYW